MRTTRVLENLDVVRDWTEIRYAAKSWSTERRVAARIEATRQGLDIRYVITNIGGGNSAWWLYESLYCGRGNAENLIKLHKNPACFRPHQLPLAVGQTKCGLSCILRPIG